MPEQGFIPLLHFLPPLLRPSEYFTPSFVHRAVKFLSPEDEFFSTVTRLIRGDGASSNEKLVPTCSFSIFSSSILSVRHPNKAACITIVHGHKMRLCHNPMPSFLSDRPLLLLISVFLSISCLKSTIYSHKDRTSLLITCPGKRAIPFETGGRVKQILDG